MVHESPLSTFDKDTTSHEGGSFLAVDDLLASNSHIVDQNIETIVHWTNTFFEAEQILKAREDFNWKSGKIFHHEEQYHKRMSYFIDQYIFSRILETSSPQFQNQTPYRAYLAHHQNGSIAISGFRHSIFYITRITKQSMTIKDIILENKIKISRRPEEHFLGVEKKSTFQGYIYTLGDENFLSRGLLFHPNECRRFLQKQTKIYRKSSSFDEMKFLNAIARLQLKYLRHPHVSCVKIYKDLPQNLL